MRQWLWAGDGGAFQAMRRGPRPASKEGLRAGHTRSPGSISVTSVQIRLDPKHPKLSASTLTLWGGDCCDPGSRERRARASPEDKGTLVVTLSGCSATNPVGGEKKKLSPGDWRGSRSGMHWNPHLPARREVSLSPLYKTPRTRSANFSRGHWRKAGLGHPPRWEN